MHRNLILVILGLALASAGPSCGSKGGGGKRPPPPTIFRLTAVSMDGATDTVARVTGNGIADADGVADTDWSVTVPMNGSALPAHGGGAYTGTLTITAIDIEDRSERIAYDIDVDP